MAVIVLDFDGTCVANEYPYVGDDIGAVPVLQDLIANGHQLILFTMRSAINGLDDAVEWFKDNNIPLAGIQNNPTQKSWTQSPKVHGDIIIDDTMLGAQLVDSRYLNWQWTAQELLKLELITDTQFQRYDFSLFVY